MGVVEWQVGQRIYLDTHLFIYAVERILPYSPHVEPFFAAAERDEITLVTSLLTLAETLVIPYRQKDDVLIAAYRELFTQPPNGLIVVPLSASILDRAARLRATASAVRLPDAIHLATAESEHCDVCVSNDKRLRGATDLEVVILSERAHG